MLVINFSDTTDTTLNGSTALADMGNGVYALSVGDTDGNAQIQNADVDGAVQQLGASGYNDADMDMNGQVQNTDVNSFITPSIGKGQQF